MTDTSPDEMAAMLMTEAAVEGALRGVHGISRELRKDAPAGQADMAVGSFFVNVMSNLASHLIAHGVAPERMSEILDNALAAGLAARNDPPKPN